MVLKHYTECKHSVFVSYAHADNEAYPGWVKRFAQSLEHTLPARIGRIAGERKRVHLSEVNGPVSGPLENKLRESIAASFAMVVVVGSNYVDSHWCMKELEHFRKLCGEEGLRERLFIAAMSRPAMLALKSRPAWQAFERSAELVWRPFHDAEDPETPLVIDGAKGMWTHAFSLAFDPLCNSLAEKIKVDLASPPLATHNADIAIGACTPELEAPVAALAAALRDLGRKAVMLRFDELVRSGLRTINAAETLVLPFSQAEPLLPFDAGGHLELQRSLWIKSGHPSDSMIWLRMADAPDLEPAGPEHLAYLAEHGADALSAKAWLASLASARKAAPNGRGVRIYIESNNLEPELWEPLGKHLEKHWESIAVDEKPPLYIRSRGLPIDDIDDNFPELSDADGVVLLWGRKEGPSLLPQINKVEDHLPGGRDVPPGIVARLTPPQPWVDRPSPPMGWAVLRFKSEHPDGVGVDDDDAERLVKFLGKVLARKRGGGLAPAWA